MHQKGLKTIEIWVHQQHNVPQAKETTVASNTFVRNGEPADEDLRALFMSSVGALAWLILTMPAVCVHVPLLQRHAREPTIGHVRLSNRLLT